MRRPPTELKPYQIPIFPCVCCGTPINNIVLQKNSTDRGYGLYFQKQKKYCSKVCYEAHRRKHMPTYEVAKPSQIFLDPHVEKLMSIIKELTIKVNQRDEDILELRRLLRLAHEDIGSMM